MTVSVAPAPSALDGSSTRLARRAVLGAQAVASLGLAAGGAAGGLLAVAVTGNDATAAMPLGALVLGAGCSAPAAAAVMARRGRLVGLVAGYLAGALGAAVVVVGAARASLPLLLAGNALLGGGNTAVMLSRYVVAELSPASGRGRAISTSMLTVTAGAVLGPNLLSPTGTIATTAGLPAPAGMYVVALLSFLIAPGLLAAANRRQETHTSGQRPAAHVRPDPAAASSSTHGRRTALTVLTSANIAMVGIMAVAPVHLAGHGHALGLVGLLISLHVGAMYVGSPLIGRLVDRHGSRPVAAAGALLFCAVGVLPALVGDVGLGATTSLLLGLGVAWNVQVVAGSALLHETTRPDLRPRAEAHGELAMSLGAAAASLLLAGPLLDAGGLALLAASTVPMQLLVLVRLGAAIKQADDHRATVLPRSPDVLG